MARVMTAVVEHIVGAKAGPYLVPLNVPKKLAGRTLEVVLRTHVHRGRPRAGRRA